MGGMEPRDMMSKVRRKFYRDRARRRINDRIFGSIGKDTIQGIVKMSAALEAFAAHPPKRKGLPTDPQWYRMPRPRQFQTEPYVEDIK